MDPQRGQGPGPNQGTSPTGRGGEDADLRAVRQALADDLSEARKHVEAGKDVPHPLVASLLDWLPYAGGVAGGILGFPEGGPAGSVLGAGILGAGGESLKQNINRMVGNPAPASPKEAATAIGVAGGMNAAAEGVGGLVAKGFSALTKRAGEGLMQSAAKPAVAEGTKAVAKGQTNPIVATLLKEGVNVSPGGIAKLDRIISATNDEIKEAIGGLGGKIDPQHSIRYAQELIPKYAAQVNPKSDVAAVEGAIDEFLGSRPQSTAFPKLRAAGVMDATPASMTAEEAQALKTGTYRALKDKAYGELKSSSIEAQKAIARGLKDDIAAEAEKAGIDITAKNAREGAAITAKEAIAKRIAAAGNRDPVALAWLAHNPVTGMAYILEKSPGVRSMLARGLYNSAAVAAHVPKEVLRLMLNAIATSQEDEP